jgi:hypothetical protein
MSYSLQAFAAYDPTAHVLPLFGLSSCVPYGIVPSQLACLPLSTPPKWNGVVVPARQAYSHSASLGWTTFFPVFRLTAAQNASALSHDTLSTQNRQVSSPATLPLPKPLALK